MCCLQLGGEGAGLLQMNPKAFCHSVPCVFHGCVWHPIGISGYNQSHYHSSDLNNLSMSMQRQRVLDSSFPILNLISNSMNPTLFRGGHFFGSSPLWGRGTEIMERR